MKPKLKFNDDGRFRILMISDFHGRPDYNPKLIEGIEALVNETAPDFVLLGGDECCGVSTDAFRKFITDVTDPFTSRAIPFGHVYGNHDNEMTISKDQCEAVYAEFPLYLGEAGPADLEGIGNCVIPVCAHDSDDVKYHIWCVDSGREFFDFFPKWGMDPDTKYVLPNHFGTGTKQSGPVFSQVRWYYKESVRREREAGHKIPGVMFMHIPLIEYELCSRNPEQTKFSGHKRDFYGTCEVNSGMFFACMQRGEVKGIFCGHEHIIDVQMEYCGITLATDTAVGYNMSAHDDLRGGRVIDVFEDGRMETRHVKLMELMGEAAMRRRDFFEGGDKYFIRDIN